MKKKLKIGLLLIATNKYKQFIEQLLQGVDKYFFTDAELSIYLFIDDTSFKFDIPSRMNVQLFKIDSFKFPYATLYRYYMFSQVKNHIDCDYVFYSDVDMKFVDFVGGEILPNMADDCGLVSVGHCGFWNGGGSWETNVDSKAYIPKEFCKRYYAGGFQGGERTVYLDACSQMSAGINDDESRGVLAVWHDESFWNRYLSISKSKMLTPSYCMVEQEDLRKKWGVDHFVPKIIALAKDHNKIRA